MGSYTRAGLSVARVRDVSVVMLSSIGFEIRCCAIWADLNYHTTRVWACGVSRWTPSLGDLIIPFIFSLISYTTYSNCTAIYCTILLFEYALITIRETASFSKGCSRVCLLGLHAATSP